MATIDVHNLRGETVGSFELADEIFAPDSVNEGLVWEAVKHFRAAMRQGTAKTKNRSEVSGSGKKLWKQKGTGRARVGSVRSPIWRHGGTVHGPQPRSYDYAFPRKKVLGALRSALAAKHAEGKLIVVDTLQLAEPKTKLYRAALDILDAKRTVLLVESSQELAVNTILGARNLEQVELLLSTEVHPYDVLRHDRAIFSKSALETLQESLKKSVSKRKLAQIRKAQVA
ncbi:50S ribosomal protein L4 [Acidipila sp. EB88]|uniref:50S ribosomal protein L4 n=1 Tax=Acidipila sp. EB88 TaxID=2305226 RepID=UPI000F5E0908|nr:50S ribosomal protein L4 [Acidipila sp. EB88]RRA47828.1 50S ribosomal protein L4 [Acidipila sp. EB88]